MSADKNGTEGTFPDFIFAGGSRCGSTWLQQALADHPEIAMPADLPVNYFDLRYHRGPEWYSEQLPTRGESVLVGESSPGYMKHPFAPRRIGSDLPDVKILFTVRNPVDRAFSEWWHERSFGNITWEFDVALEHHPAFDMLLRPGFYDQFLGRFEEYVDTDQILVSVFDDFKRDNRGFVRDVYAFLGVDESYEPSVLNERVNEASHLSPRLNHLKSWVHHNTPEGLYERIVRPAYQPLKRVLERDSAYKRGVPNGVRAEMQAVFEHDVRALEERIDRDLDHWLDQLNR